MSCEQLKLAIRFRVTTASNGPDKMTRFRKRLLHQVEKIRVIDDTDHRIDEHSWNVVVINVQARIREHTDEPYDGCNAGQKLNLDVKITMLESFT